MAKELLKRNEVPEEKTWKTSDIFPSMSEWEKTIEEVAALGDKIVTYQGKVGKSAADLYDVLSLMEEAEEKISLVYCYASLFSDQDTANAENQEKKQKAMSAYIGLNSKIAFIDPEIIAIPEETIKKYAQELEELKQYEVYIKEVQRTKSHKLSSEMEGLLASAGEVMESPTDIYMTFENADLKFPEITGEDGEKIRLTTGRFVPLQESQDRRVRKEAFEALYHTYDQYKNTLASSYRAEINARMFRAKARKYASTLEAAVDGNNVSPIVYKNLVEVINENLDKMHHYVRLRKKCLGVDELHMYDVYAPMIADVAKKIPFDEAKETILKALEPMGEEYVSLIKKGFESRWIDECENEGKRSGAYSMGVYGVHPYVLMNYNGTLDNMFTLAHEMGHALHSYFSNEAQSFFNADYVIFVAEVASTCNEVLLMEYLLAHTTDKKERAYLLNHYLDSFKSTVYRQTMFAEYEMITNKMAEDGEGITADSLKKVYFELNQKYFGDAMISDEEIALEWAKIPHFYMNFYVYQYATGFSAAVALANKILKEGKPAVDNYLKFLSGGCTDSPVNLLKIAGVDMEKKESIQSALDIFGRLIDEMEELV